MTNQQGDLARVIGVIEQYFHGLYHADIILLASICDEGLVLITPNQRRPLQQWLKDVDSRLTPKNEREAYEFEILSVEIHGDQAMVKLHCPLLGHKYTDFIGLLKEQNQWKIVSKMYV